MRTLKSIFLMLLSLAANSIFAQKADTLLVYFETDSYGLTTTETEKLARFIEAYKGIPISKVSIYAYCDDRGSEEYNMVLSRKRALSIQKKFASNGYNSSSIVCNGEGEIPLLKTLGAQTVQRKNNRKALISIETKKVEEIKTIDPILENKDSTEEKLNLKKMKVGDKITLKNILFIGGRHVLLPESYTSLEDLVNKLNENPEIHILILGHICCQYDGKDGLDHDTGKENLSVARAQAIQDYLIENGINKNRLQYKGLKGSFPTGKDVKYDRRVEIEITKANLE